MLSLCFFLWSDFRSPRRLPSSHLLGLISGGFTLDKTHHIRSHLFRVDDEDNYHHHHHYHLIVSKSKDNGVEDGLENDQRVGECVEKKTEHRVHVTVAELAALETIIIVVAVVIIIIMACRHIPTMTNSHHGGEMSIMKKVGMCQCQNPTVHDKVQLGPVGSGKLFNMPPVLRHNISAQLGPSDRTQ